jgi:hypothetical protein
VLSLQSLLLVSAVVGIPSICLTIRYWLSLRFARSVDKKHGLEGLRAIQPIVDAATRGISAEATKNVKAIKRATHQWPRRT